MLYHPDYTPAYETLSAADGTYVLENVEKGYYRALYALDLQKYPRVGAVPEDEMRLEYWAWNVVATQDLTINPRYHRLELYGTTVSKMTGQKDFLIYFRPMSLAKTLQYENYRNKEQMEAANVDISVPLDQLKVEVFGNEEALEIRKITPVQELVESLEMTGYLLQVSVPEELRKTDLIAFRVVAEYLEKQEKGENICFFEPKHYL